MASNSSALIRKPEDTDLMPPPPIKRIKRPPKVLDEDVYTEALSEIIARDFFPGLIESKHQQEYLDALESADSEWIAEASRKLTEVMDTPQHRRRGTSFATPKPSSSFATPQRAPETLRTSTTEDTPPAAQKPNTNMSLTAFQAKYTSEDNASFNTLLDKQNEKRRNAYAFLWNNNRIPGFRTKAHQKRLAAAAESADKDVKLLVAPDDRPAIPNTWNTAPRNSLMFIPDTSPPPPDRKEGEKEPPPKSVVYFNTRVPLPTPSSAERPGSPSSSIIADAIAGRPRLSDSDPGFGAAETPRVAGYSFVDAAPSPSPSELGAPPLTWGTVASSSSTSPSPSTSTPFKIAATPKRELLHHRMVEKVAKNKREASSNPLLTAAKTPGGAKMTPLGGSGRGREIPKFGSSPALTPAGQRLWGNIMTGQRKDTTAATGLREHLLRTPAAKKAAAERHMPTPRAGK